MRDEVGIGVVASRHAMKDDEPSKTKSIPACKRSENSMLPRYVKTKWLPSGHIGTRTGFGMIFGEQVNIQKARGSNGVVFGCGVG